uniref:Protein arginine methyltransferase NDUFAF7 n=1 Tax=Caenorhabditis japonica TaxID=281687 RepID=A0A8R1HI87_CAEJA
MKSCVSAPTVGYYGQFSDSQKVFGPKGDFITSPELSQLFGEMIGVWCRKILKIPIFIIIFRVFNELANTGHRGAWQLVELGPGRAQLMNVVLNSLAKFQDQSVSIHLVETSDALIDEQERVLCLLNSEKVEGELKFF